MSDTSTKRMIEMYVERSDSPMFLSQFFRTPAENFHDKDKVEIDVVRSEPRVAVPLPHKTAKARRQQLSKYVNKGYDPCPYDLEVTLSAYTKHKRQPGMDPFDDADFVSAITNEATNNMRELEGMIRRGVELQCAQVLQEGAIDLKDEAGNTMFATDFEAKSTHLITVGTTWATSGASGNPLGDLGDAADVVRQDGKHDPDILLFGTSSLQRFLANADVKEKLDSRNANVIEVRPQKRNGATFQGWVWVGNYRFEMWSYNATYIDPQTGAHTPYLVTDNVVMLSSTARLDMTYGSIPSFLEPDARAAQFLPSRISSVEKGVDLSTNAWVDPDGKHLHFTCGTRALAIPTAIDSFARINVTA